MLRLRSALHWVHRSVNPNTGILYQLLLSVNRAFKNWGLDRGYVFFVL